MTRNQELVKMFHEKFGLTVNDVPCIPSRADRKLRVALIAEELDELIEGFDNEDIVQVADALMDLLYVVHGTAITCGLNDEPLFAEVHRSNMTKEGGVKREDGKLLKPLTYTQPNLLPLLGGDNK